MESQTVTEESAIQKAANAYVRAIDAWTKTVERRKAAEIEMRESASALIITENRMHECRAKLDVLVT